MPPTEPPPPAAGLRLPGRVAGTYPEFKYGESIVALGATGFAWNEADFVNTQVRYRFG